MATDINMDKTVMKTAPISDFMALSLLTGFYWSRFRRIIKMGIKMYVPLIVKFIMLAA